MDRDPGELRAPVEAVAWRHGLDLVVLFGSQASGVTHADSDVDLAVRLRAGPLDMGAFLDVTAAFEEVFPGRKIDLCDLRRADPLLLHKVFERGVALYQAPAAFAAARLAAFHRYQDYRPYLRMERDAVRRALGLGPVAGAAGPDAD